MTKEQLKALEELIEYVWRDEELSYEEHEQPKENHIFLSIRKLNDYLADMKEESDE